LDASAASPVSLTLFPFLTLKHGLEGGSPLVVFRH
jgi:hypothetical protein